MANRTTPRGTTNPSDARCDSLPAFESLPRTLHARDSGTNPKRDRTWAMADFERSGTLASMPTKAANPAHRAAVARKSPFNGAEAMKRTGTATAKNHALDNEDFWTRPLMPETPEDTPSSPVTGDLPAPTAKGNPPSTFDDETPMPEESPSVTGVLPLANLESPDARAKAKARRQSLGSKAPAIGRASFAIGDTASRTNTPAAARRHARATLENSARARPNPMESRLPEQMAPPGRVCERDTLLRFFAHDSTRPREARRAMTAKAIPDQKEGARGWPAKKPAAFARAPAYENGSGPDNFPVSLAKATLPPE